MKKGREKSINSADFLTSNGAYQKYNKKYVTMCINNITPNGKIKKKINREKFLPMVLQHNIKIA